MNSIVVKLFILCAVLLKLNSSVYGSSPAPLVEGHHYVYSIGSERRKDVIRVTIIGEVDNPGIYYFTQPVSIKDAFLVAKPNRFTSLARIILVRGSGVDEKRYTLSLKGDEDEGAEKVKVSEGDIIFVPRRLI